MNVEAFENLKRILGTVPADQFEMSNWKSCAIGHACHDAWFMKRGLCTSFASAQRVFGLSKPEALYSFSLRAGRTPDEVLATINRFVGSTAVDESERHAHRQAIIDGMLAAASRVDQTARKVARALVAAFGL